MKRSGILVLLVLFGTDLWADTRGRLCITATKCRNASCGDAVVPADEPRAFTYLRADRSHELGALGAGQSTFTCDARGRLKLRIQAEKFTKDDAIQVLVAREHLQWKIDLTEKDARADLNMRLAPGEYDVTISSARFVSHHEKVTVHERTQIVSAKLELLPTITGVVRNRDASIAGAIIMIDDTSVAFTDARGRFTLHLDPRQWPANLTVKAVGYAQKTVSIPPARRSTLLNDIELSKGGSLRIDLQQPAVLDLREIELRELRREGRQVGAVVATITPPKEPIVSIPVEGIEPGSYLVVAKGDDRWERLAEPVEIVEGAEAELSMHIVPFTVRLTTYMGEERLPNARAGFRNIDSHWDAVVVTNDMGEAAMTLWQGGRMSCVISAEGTTPYKRSVTISDGIDAQLTLDVPLHEIYGVVIDAVTEKPVPGAAISLQVKGEDREGRLAVRTKSGADGSYRFAPVGYGHHVLKVFAVGYPPTEIGYAFQEPETTRQVTIKLDSRALYRLDVLDHRELPVANARVMAFNGLTRVADTQTDATGTAVLSIPPGESRDAYVIPRDGSFGVFQLRADLGSAPVRVLEGSARIVIRTETSAQDPVPNVVVLIRHNGKLLPPETYAAFAERGSRTNSGAQGRIVLEHMPPGLYEFWPAGSMAELRQIASGAGADAPVKMMVGPGENVAVMTFASVKQP